MKHGYKCHRCDIFAEVATIGSADLCIVCMKAENERLQAATSSEYWVKINEFAFENLLLKLEVEELQKEVNDLMRDKIELSCELSMVNS